MRIQIVEDEKNIAQGISCIMTEQSQIPCTVKIASDGKAGLKLAASFAPHLTITDVRMFPMNGLDMIRLMQEQKLCKRFIVLSGYDNFPYVQAALRCRCIDYLLKPVDKRQLLSLVEEVYHSIAEELSLEKRSLPDCEFFQMDISLQDYPTSLQRVLQYLEQNYMLDITQQSAGENLMLHPTYISSLINKYLKVNFACLLDFIRLRKAAELLIYEPDMSISEISYLTGYTNERRFYLAFQNRLSCTPGDFRKTYAAPGPLPAKVSKPLPDSGHEVFRKE